MKYLVANWKANKNLEETKQWLEVFTNDYQVKENVSVIIAPPFPFLQKVKETIKGLTNVYVSAQDVSQFEEGTFTGEVTARSLQGLANYSIIGHSERKKHFSEDEESIRKKIILAKQFDVEPILCIQEAQAPSLNSVRFIAYEPSEAISKGETDISTRSESLEEIIQFKKSLSLTSVQIFLYGGSIRDENVQDYLTSGEIEGFLIGGASLDPERFLRIISKV